MARNCSPDLKFEKAKAASGGQAGTAPLLSVLILHFGTLEPA